MTVVVRWAPIGTRVLLPQVVAEVADVAPEDVTLVQRCERCGGPHGRPVVWVRGRSGPHVSASHTDGISIVAVSRAAVGVDVEPHGVDPSWVRTEAVLKATGHGLEVDPSLVDVSGTRLTGWRGPGRRPNVRLADVDLGREWCAAVARVGRLPFQVDARAFSS